MAFLWGSKIRKRSAIVKGFRDSETSWCFYGVPKFRTVLAWLGGLLTRSFVIHVNSFAYNLFPFTTIIFEGVKGFVIDHGWCEKHNNFTRNLKIAPLCKTEVSILRTGPTNSKVFLRGLLNVRGKQILTSDIEIQKENWE